MITYRATLDVPAATVVRVARWLAAHRKVHDRRGVADDFLRIVRLWVVFGSRWPSSFAAMWIGGPPLTVSVAKKWLRSRGYEPQRGAVDIDDSCPVGQARPASSLRMCPGEKMSLAQQPFGVSSPRVCGNVPGRVMCARSGLSSVATERGDRGDPTAETHLDGEPAAGAMNRRRCWGDQ